MYFEHTAPIATHMRFMLSDPVNTNHRNALQCGAHETNGENKKPYIDHEVQTRVYKCEAA